MSDLLQTSCACASIVLHMDKNFEINWTKIEGGCQSYTKAAPQQSWSDLTLEELIFLPGKSGKIYSSDRIDYHYDIYCE